MKALIIEHPFYVQLLSFLTIGLHVRNQNWGFNIGKIMEIILLNSPLLSWDGILDYKDISKEKLSSIVLLILNYNVINKKWYKQYMTIFEQSNYIRSM
jgi:DNA-binding transcriptional regulator GbsR (MarR family)